MRTSEVRRVEKRLEDAVIKLGAVASSTLTKSGRAMIEALIAGERDPAVRADLAKGRLRAKIPELVRALDGRFETHHAQMLRLHLDHIDHLDAAIATIDSQVDELIVPFYDVRARLQTIPGVGQKVADVIIAETSANMDRFPNAAHLASWAGVGLSRQQRVRRQTVLRPHPQGRHLAAGRTGRGRLGRCADQGCYLAAAAEISMKFFAMERLIHIVNSFGKNNWAAWH